MRLARFVLPLLTALALAACGDRGVPAPKTAFNGTDISAASFAQDFHLTDHNGKPRSMADFKGKVVLVFFGYTHCPDVCPGTLGEASAMVRELGPDAGRVQVLFVTVDPQRDTPEVLAAYVPSFNKDFLGLYGDQDATQKVVKDFKLFVQKVPGKQADAYTIDHTAGLYVFDPQGHPRLFVGNNVRAPQLAQDVKQLLAGA